MRAHSLFVVFLAAVGLCAFVSLGVAGWSYYLTPFSQRPFTPEYSSFKPSGTYSHGLGIIGSLLIIVGVSTYSTRKRVRALSNSGRISTWLEVHIFLCLLGPILVLYHTTFKIGGVATISFWTMMSVALSGIVGRFLYVHIPRNLKGMALSEAEISSQLSMMGDDLKSSPIGARLVGLIDESLERLKKPENLGQTLMAFLELEKIKRTTRKKIRQIVAQSGVDVQTAARIQYAALERASLRQKSALLKQAEAIFHYWHVIHLPFSIIMFLTLAMHVTVVLLLGYRWL